MNRSQRVFKILGIIVLIMLILMVAGVFLAYYHKDRIVEEIKEELKLSIKSELGFQDANLKFFKTFPEISLELTQFYILNQPGYQCKNQQYESNDTLLRSGQIYFELDMLQLFSGNVLVNSIKIHEGSLQLLENQEGLSNYGFLLESEDAEDKTSRTIQLESAELKDISLDYLSLPSGTFLNGKFNDLKISGQIDSIFTLFEVKGLVWVDHLNQDSATYLSDFSSEIRLNYLQDTDNLSIETFQFKADGIDLNGSLNYQFKTEELNLSFESTENQLKNLLIISPYASSLLPDSIETAGLLSLKGTYKVNFLNDQFGKYAIEGSLKKGELLFQEDSVRLINVEAQSDIYNDALDQIIFNNLIFKTDFPLGGSAQLNAKVILYDLLDLSGNLILTLEPEQLANWSGMPELAEWNGRLAGRFALRGVRLDLNLDNLELIRELRPEGTFEISSSSYNSGEYQIGTSSIRFDLNNENLRFGPFEMTINNQKINLETLEFERIYDILNFQKIRLNASIKTSGIDLLQIIPVSKKTEESARASNKGDTYVLSGSVRFKADEVTYDRFKARQASGIMELGAEQILLKNVQMQTLNGKIELDAGLKLPTTGKDRIELDAKLDDIDLHELLFSFRNFDQAYLTHKELIGDLSGQVNLTAAIDSGLKPDYTTLKGRVSFILKKGEITDLNSLRKMADFTHLEELQKIEFEAIQGSAELTEGELKVYPSFIKSSVADINFYGDHSLGQEMDYRFEILLSPAITGKKTEHLESVEQGGRTKIYLKLSGSEKDYSVSYDMRALKDATKARVKEEGTILKDAFRREFGNNDTINQKIETKRDDAPVKKKAKVIWE